MEHSQEQLFKTPLNAWHKAHGARMVPFAGWEMPVQYEGIIVEHNHTRTNASLFDICHMGEFRLAGPGSLEALEKIVTHNLRTLPPGKCRYGFMLNPEGGILDDMIIYRLADEEFMVVVNGACEASDYDWICRHLPAGLRCDNISAQTAKIDLQGPASLDVLESCLGEGFRQLKYFSFATTLFQGATLLVSRTGYTGELGYELYLPADHAQALWERLLEDDRVKPAGLGARDTLRLEMGLPLYGQDLDTEHTPFEAGLEMFAQNPADFIGKDKMTTVREKRVALEIPGRRSARHHDKVLLPSGEEIGHVTSASFAPSLGYCVALAYVKPESAEAEAFTVQAQRVTLEAKPADLPFYKSGTARKKLD